MAFAIEPSGEPAPRVMRVSTSGANDDRTLFAASDPDAGLVVVPVSPTVQSIGRLAGDVLAALGKDSLIAPYGRTREAEGAWAHDWLVGHEVRRVVFAYCDDLERGVLAQAYGLAQGAGAEAWFLFRADRAVVQAAALFGVSVDALPTDGLPDTLRDARTARAVPVRSARPLRVPDLGPLRTDPERIGAIQLIRRVVDSGSPSIAEMAGAAAVAIGPQWELSVVDEARLARPYSLLPVRSTRLFSWRSLRRTRDTAQAAACVLAALRVSVTELLALRASHVASDGSAVSVVRDTLPVPEGLRAYLRARLATVRRLGLAPDPLFLASRVVPPKPAALRTLVSAGFDELGVIFPRGEMEYRISAEERWLDRHGLTLTRLYKPQRKPVLFTRPGRTKPSATYRTIHRRFDARW